MSYYDGLEPGSQIDSYRIEAPVARSGMATILPRHRYARRRMLLSRFPIPTWKPIPFCSTASSAKPGIGERLRHPGVMGVYGGERRSRVYMAMESCHGPAPAQYYQ